MTVAFGPEHGFRGTADAGEHVSDSVDEETGVPVRSLYGSGTGGPSAEDLDLFDTLVIDIQDVGLRYYTYYISMYHLMDACAASGRDVVILDRPNPNGFYVDGSVLKDGFVSGVGVLPVSGLMTLLSQGGQCEPIPLTHWRKDALFTGRTIQIVRPVLLC